MPPADVPKKRMSQFVFYALISLRIILPPIIALTCHPLLSILLIEGVVDGLMSPHHVALYTPFDVPLSKENVPAAAYDKPLDFWGQLWTMYPVWFVSSKYYGVFKNFRVLLCFLFLFRVFGYVLFWLTFSVKTPDKSRRLFIIFPNVYLLVYILIAMISLVGIQSGTLVYLLLPFLVLAAVFKEYQLHYPQSDFRTLGKKLQEQGLLHKVR